MSKITFRADDDLVDQLEGLDSSKSEAMREALRTYLETDERRLSDDVGRDQTETAIDDLLEDRLGRRQPHTHASDAQDVNVTIALEGVDGHAESRQVTRADQSTVEDSESADPRNRSQPAGQTTCGQCGEHVDGEHVYCPNCGEKATHRLFCECGDELRSDWSFCPGCGRRTPAADVLESS